MSACIPDPWATYSKRLTGHEFYIVCAGKWLVRSGHPPRGGGGGGRHWATVLPQVWGGTVVPGGGGVGHGGG